MATIRKSGGGWQALIRKKNYLGQRAKTFPTKKQAQLWADVVERSLQPPKGLTDKPPKILKEAIESYIEGPLKHHRSGHNEKYPLQVTANSWLGGVVLSELSIRHLALWRDERLIKVKANTAMRELRILRVLLDWARDELGCDLASNPARELKIRGTCDARIPYLTEKQEQKLLQQLAQSSNPNHLRLTQLALATGMRRSELLAIHWSDLDLNKGLLRLNRKGCAANGLRNSQRLAPLSQTTITLLKRFPQSTNKVINLSPGAARRGFDQAKIAVGLSDLHFHDLRHVGITRMWSQGMNALQIAQISGHKDLKMLMRYSHYGLGA